ncbi:ChbG/HpnK family deacetylase [Eisenbergiella tayi]|uniref:ChbG/HpnK family deacetylase n=1 Tax=Eisenbergiella tayi TaxID=1432052 RepID=UPI000848504A|nr:ChbG/HpnK family deacetylase [Eisenbergiella tayi]ODR36013.1 hypothetical protein BEI60_15400 [Eisenbergiella tayi]
MLKIDIHADDYAISPHFSEDILSCLHAGKLDSISVLTNMSCYEEYADRLRREQKNWPKKPLLTIHLNFLEGHCVACPEEVPHLINEEGYFNIGWLNLFKWNYSPGMFMTIKRELKAEIKAQTEKFRERFGDDAPFRFDGHQHTQMLPLVYWALLEVIVEQQYRTEYIRVTKEPILPYIKNVSLWKTYKPINCLKNLILNFYAPGMEETIQKSGIKWQQENSPMLLWGVLMSGCMDKERVRKLLPAMESASDKNGRRLEILFHPGTVLPMELGKEFSNLVANEFYMSKGRELEKETVMCLEIEEKE